MQKVIKSIQKISLKRVFSILVISCFLIGTTACNQGTMAQVDPTTQVSRGYDKYDANQDYKGGMNGYNDDLRYDAGTAAKTKGLIDTANNRKVDNLDEFADNVGDSLINKDEAGRALEKFGDKLEKNTEQAAKYIDNKSDKLERNLGKVPGEAKEIFNNATDTARNAVEDATKATKETAKEIKGNFEDLS